MSPYAQVLSLGKLNPYPTLDEALNHLFIYNNLVTREKRRISLDSTPEWVKAFYHPETLKETIAWMNCLKRNKEYFFISCLLGILHHQRPGFLSYPASHGAPYLRTSKYPRNIYPEMYAYKNVFDRLQAKVQRVYKNFPILDYSKARIIWGKDASAMRLGKVPRATIITSPPYMRSLTYARDNRLRLWFLGLNDWKALDTKISPTAQDFANMMTKCLKKWSQYQLANDKCIIIIGDITLPQSDKAQNLAEFLEHSATPYYRLIEAYQDPIPEIKKLVKGNTRIKREIIIALERR